MVVVECGRMDRYLMQLPIVTGKHYYNMRFNTVAFCDHATLEREDYMVNDSNQETLMPYGISKFHWGTRMY